MSSVTLAWLAELVLITYRAGKQQSVGGPVDPQTGQRISLQRPIAHLPMPSEYAATFVIYGALSLIPGRGEQMAGLVGWGIVVATLLNLWDPTTVGNRGGVAVKGGPGTKSATAAPVVNPQTAVAQGS